MAGEFYHEKRKKQQQEEEQTQMLCSEVGGPLIMAANNVSSSSRNPPAAAAIKKKRNFPGTPDPSAEVIALSPTALMARNRFICEICGKGFQREQNLQLHRRGHNLPWKLTQRSASTTVEVVVKKKVYVCPETTCVHHHPSRALGDLTGIKKHFFRKHGEKKWRCDKCSKRYAVQSDWKAHSKTCGTREYRCDCGSIFSRRDSFVTHRAFCETLAEESNKMNKQLLSSLQFHHQTMYPMNNNGGPSNCNRSSTQPSINPSFTNGLVPMSMSGTMFATMAGGSSTTTCSSGLPWNGFTKNGSNNTSETALLQRSSQMGSIVNSSDRVPFKYSHLHNHRHYLVGMDAEQRLQEERVVGFNNQGLNFFSQQPIRSSSPSDGNKKIYGNSGTTATATTSTEYIH